MRQICNRMRQRDAVSTGFVPVAISIVVVWSTHWLGWRMANWSCWSKPDCRRPLVAWSGCQFGPRWRARRVCRRPCKWIRFGCNQSIRGWVLTRARRPTIPSCSASRPPRSSRPSVSAGCRRLSFPVRMNWLSWGWSSCDENCKLPSNPECASGYNSPPRQGSDTYSTRELEKFKSLMLRRREISPGTTETNSGFREFPP